MTKKDLVSEEIRTSFQTVKMTRTVLTDIKVAISTQEGQCITKKE